MKKLISLLLSVLLIICLALPAAAQKEAAGNGLTADVCVLFTSDVHCGVDKNFTYAGLAAARESMKDAGYHVLLVDNGDSIQGETMGTLTSGKAVLDLMNKIGYDAVIPGNHEFDYGMDRFLQLAGEADFPYLSCNFNKEGELVFPPYHIFTFDDVKIAFVGVTTPESLTSSNPKHFQNEDGEYIYGFMQGDDGEPLYEAVQKAVDDARAEGAAYVVLLAHLGNQAACIPYTYADVISHTNGIDAVLDGHSHDSDKYVVKNKDGADVVRQACGTKMNGIGVLWIRTDGSVDTDLYTWNNSISAPELLGFRNMMTKALDEARAVVEAAAGAVIGETPVDLITFDPTEKDLDGNKLRLVRLSETNLGDLCADAFRKATGADVAIINGGSLRADIAKGEITKGNVLDVMPYGNDVPLIKVTGQQILDALEWGAKDVPGESGRFLQVSGLTYEIHADKDSSCTADEDGLFTGVTGEYRVQNVMVGGVSLEPEKAYTLTSNSFMLKDKGDGNAMFADCEEVPGGGVKDVQAVIDYLEELTPEEVGNLYADPHGLGRITILE